MYTGLNGLMGKHDLGQFSSFRTIHAEARLRGDEIGGYHAHDSVDNCSLLDEE